MDLVSGSGRGIGTMCGLMTSWQTVTHDGRPIKILTVLDEYSRECLAIVVERGLRSDDVLDCLTELFVKHGPPEHIRSDNGPSLRLG